MHATLREGLPVPKYVEVPSDDPVPPGGTELIVSRELRDDHSERTPPPGSMSQGGGQLDPMPIWAKVGATLSAISIISGLLVYLVVHQVNSDGNTTMRFERLMDKFDLILEKHDGRSREWMKAHGERITNENEKTRMLMIENEMRRDKSMAEMTRLNESQLSVLRQIRDEKKMP